MQDLDIQSAQYFTDLDGITNMGITLTLVGGETWSVPLIAGNTHYDEIMRQVEAGTLTIQEAE